MISDLGGAKSTAERFHEQLLVRHSLGICLDDFEGQLNSFPARMTLVYWTWPRSELIALWL